MGAGVSETRIVMLGAPGSGKGTQAAFLAQRLGVPAISTGDMLRAAVAAGSPLGRRVQSTMDAGRLVDDEMMAEVVESRLAEPDARAGFILDGYPRTGPQAETLAGILARRQEELDWVVQLEVPEDKLVERALLRGRSDDKQEVVRERLRQYHQKTAPLVDYYRERGLLLALDGDRDIAEVTRAIETLVELRGSGER